MPLGRLAHGVREAWEVPRDLLLGRYPAFVTGGTLARGEVPVFVLHEAEPAAFARQLDAPGAKRLPDALDRRVRGGVARPRPSARARSAAQLRRRPRLGVERRGSAAAEARDAGRGVPGSRARAVARPAAGRPGRGAHVLGGDRRARARRPLRFPEPHADARASSQRPAARGFRHAGVAARLRGLRPAARAAGRSRLARLRRPARHAAPGLVAANIGGPALLRGRARAGRLRLRGGGRRRRGLLRARGLGVASRSGHARCTA